MSTMKAIAFLSASNIVRGSLDARIHGYVYMGGASRPKRRKLGDPLTHHTFLNSNAGVPGSELSMIILL